MEINTAVHRVLHGRDVLYIFSRRDTRQGLEGL
jgi:hypothetical protein